MRIDHVVTDFEVLAMQNFDLEIGVSCLFN